MPIPHNEAAPSYREYRCDKSGIDQEDLVELDNLTARSRYRVLVTAKLRKKW